MADDMNSPLLVTVSPPMAPADEPSPNITGSPRSITPPLVPLGQKRAPYIPERSSDQFHRMKFYGALEKVERQSPAQSHYQNHYSSQSTEPGQRSPGSPGYGGSPSWTSSPRTFLPPANVVPSYLYMVGTNRHNSNARGRKPSVSGDGEEEQGRVATITSLVNTMMGSTIMALPWGFFESGLVGGILIVGLACVCSFVTAAMVVSLLFVVVCCLLWSLLRWSLLYVHSLILLSSSSFLLFFFSLPLSPFIKLNKNLFLKK